VFFTGLSGSGKTTIANALVERLMELDTRSVCVLDGDHVRRMLSSELGFSLEHRNLNVRRIGYVASQVVKPGGVAITALISPYRQAREEARKIVSENGAFIEVFLSTSVDVCEKRDRKGLYRKAREVVCLNIHLLCSPTYRTVELHCDCESLHALRDALSAFNVFCISCVFDPNRANSRTSPVSMIPMSRQRSRRW